MMTRNILAASMLAAMVLAGCNGDGSDKIMTGPVNAVEADGLGATLTIPTRNYRIGDKVPASITVTNTTDEPATIRATTGAPIYLHVERWTGLAWEPVLTFPEAAIMVMSPWTLKPGASRTFEMTLTVEPDWPTNEMLRLVAEVNGRPQLRPALTFEVEGSDVGPEPTAAQ
jgi:hypothetical protein